MVEFLIFSLAAVTFFVQLLTYLSPVGILVGIFLSVRGQRALGIVLCSISLLLLANSREFPWLNKIIHRSELAETRNAQPFLRKFAGVWKHSLLPESKIVIFTDSSGEVFSKLRNWGGDGIDRESHPVEYRNGELWIHYAEMSPIRLSPVSDTEKRLKYVYFGDETDQYMERE